MKKYINRILSGALLLGLSVAAVSCSEDYLETTPTDSVGSADAVANTTMAYASLNGVAKLMTTQHYYFGQGFAGENHVMNKMEDYPSDNYDYNYYASGWSPIFNQEFHFRSNSIYDYYAWYYYYTIIGNANTIIANIDNADGLEADKKFIKASALTFRAFAFEKLARYYCYSWAKDKTGASQGLILQLDESIEGKPFSTLAETFAQIYKDCEDAIKLFNESGLDRPAGDCWTPNINVAHAVYARAALSKGDYDTAITHAKAAKVGYPLMSNSDYVAGFMEANQEWIFGSFGGSEENNWYWSYGTQYSCNGYYAEASACGAGSINRELINRIPNDDVRKALFLSEDKFDISSTANCPYFAAYGLLGMSDDNLWTSVATYVASVVPDAYAAGYFYLGGQLKFRVFDAPGISYLPYIRTAEMILIEAEANYKKGSTTAAQTALNELNQPRNAAYVCTSTGDALWQEIKDYHGLELFGEGQRWSALKRWDEPVVRTALPVGGTSAAVAITIPKATENSGNNYWTWAIPDGETDYNDALKLYEEEPAE